jgi:hypothetical protein
MSQVVSRGDDFPARIPGFVSLSGSPLLGSCPAACARARTVGRCRRGHCSASAWVHALSRIDDPSPIVVSSMLAPARDSEDFKRYGYRG